MLAALCATTYGVADYCGGRASRSVASTVVALLGQATSMVLVVVGIVLLGTPIASAHDLWWGAAGGAAGALALIAFYRALARGAMTVVAPTTAVISAVLPVIVGLALGERPSTEALVGIVIACLAVALVSGAIGTRHGETKFSTVMLAAAAGVGFGFIFIAFARTAGDSGMWPLLAARVASVARRGGHRRRDATRHSAGCVRSSGSSWHPACSTWQPTCSTSRQVIAGC